MIIAWQSVKLQKKLQVFNENKKNNLIHHLESTHEESYKKYIASKYKPQTYQLIIEKESGTL